MEQIKPFSLVAHNSTGDDTVFYKNKLGGFAKPSGFEAAFVIPFPLR